MAVSGTHDGGAQQVLVFVYHHQYVYQEGKEQHVPFRILARCKQIDTRIGAKRPVVVLAGAVHAVVGFFVKQYGEVMLACDAFHQIHHKLVVVVGKVGILKDRRQLKLVGSYFVMAGLDRDTQFVTFDFQFFHKSCDTWGDGAEIVVLQLLVFGRGVSHQGTSGQTKVRAGIVQCRVDEEIFLFPA